MQSSALFIVEQWIFNEPVSPFSTGGAGKAVEPLKSISVFLDHCLCLVLIISSLSPSSSIYFLSVNNQRTSKWGKGWGRFLSCIRWNCLMWHMDRRERKFTYHKKCSFCLQQPKMDLFFPLLSASSLRQERTERVWRADTMSQSEARVSVREREGR